MTDQDIYGFIRTHLRDESSQWNLGTFGAIAEFMRDPGEPVALTEEGGRLSAVTARGGIGFGDLSGVRLFASETAIGETWSHRVALCLPTDACAMNSRTVLTELGPDMAPLRETERDAPLFDMGLGTLQVDVCIRTADTALIRVLRAESGRSLFEPGNPAMAAIVSAGPHRVFVARFGRCEVYQPIPPADGRSPEGPHTHVLPKLLAHGRTHAANELVPAGFVPCAHLVPAHPVKDGMGRPRPFDSAAQEAFQAMLARFGDPDLAALKARIAAAVAAGKSPDSLDMPAGRFARHAARVAVRQLAYQTTPSTTTTAWLAALGGARDEDGAPHDDYGHA